ncbi:MAG: hypothetical protein L0I84_01915 [Halomonas subglaciescola]|nr:hypothetical protein [Halomonas subglaciescola]
MKTINTHSAAVLETLEALKDRMSPVITRKHAIIRTCGNEPTVEFDPAEGAFHRKLSAKPPRWIVRIEGPLDQPDALVVEPEGTIGQYNMTQPVGIVVARVLFLHRKNDTQSWEAVPHYECRVVIIVDPPLPLGSSSVALRTVPASPPASGLAPSVAVTRRGSPTQTISIHQALLISPPPDNTESIATQSQRSAMESALLRALEAWPMMTVCEASDQASQMAFARVFDRLETQSITHQILSTSTLPEVHVSPDVFRRLSLAVEAGFKRFVVVARELQARHGVAEAAGAAIKDAGSQDPMLTLIAAKESDPARETSRLQALLNDAPGWVLLASSRAQALSSFDGGMPPPDACMLSVYQEVSGRQMLQQAYRNVGMTPPADTDDLSRHLLFITWQVLDRIVPECFDLAQMDALLQLCLRLAPGNTAWEVPVNDDTQRLWADALSLTVPMWLMSAGQNRKEEISRRLGDAAELSEQEALNIYHSL